MKRLIALICLLSILAACAPKWSVPVTIKQDKKEYKEAQCKQ